MQLLNRTFWYGALVLASGIAFAAMGYSAWKASVKIAEAEALCKQQKGTRLYGSNGAYLGCRLSH